MSDERYPIAEVSRAPFRKQVAGRYGER